MQPKQLNSLQQIISTLLCSQFLLLEQRLWALLAVVHYLASLLEAVNVVGTQREEYRRGQWTTLISEKPLYGVQYAGGVIHRAIGIHCHRESLFTKALPYGVGKARAHEEHLFAWLYLKVWLLYIYYRPEFHYFNS